MKIGRLTIEFHISWEGSYIKKVKAALKEGKKIEAIKIYKNATGTGLKESKYAVDVIEMEYIMKKKSWNKLPGLNNLINKTYAKVQ